MARFKEENLNTLSVALKQRETEILSPIATLSVAGVRRFHEVRLEEGYRLKFSVDVDRILHSRAYTRYIDKTQVFYPVSYTHLRAHET